MQYKTPLQAAKAYAAAHAERSAEVRVRYLRPRTGHISVTRYYIGGGNAQPDRGYFDNRNGHCPVCGKVYLDTVVKQSWTRPDSNLFVVACQACAERHGWDQHWRPGAPQPDPEVKANYKDYPYIHIDMIDGSIEERA